MDISLLPPHLKMMILGHLDTTSQNEVLSVRADNSMAPVTFLDQLASIQSGSHQTNDGLVHFSRVELEQLETQGYIIKDDFIRDDPNLIDQVLLEIARMMGDGTMHHSGMNSGKEKWVDDKIRGDLHCWLNKSSEQLEANPALAKMISKIDELRVELNEKCNFNSQETQTQVACYPGLGSRYVRHLDSTANGPNRRLTCLLYLNKNWKKEDGGCLRIFKPNSIETKNSQINHNQNENILDEVTIDVEPLANRLLIFQSRTIPHEVLPSYSDRMAITMWFY